MAQQWRALPASAEASGYVPSTLTTVQNSSSRDPTPSSDFHGSRHPCGVYIHVGRTIIHIKCLFQDRVSLCSHGCPGTHSVDHAGLEHTEIYLPLSPSAGNKGVHHHCPAEYFLKLKHDRRKHSALLSGLHMHIRAHSRKHRKKGENTHTHPHNT